jgi:hypothetical protein
MHPARLAATAVLAVLALIAVPLACAHTTATVTPPAAPLAPFKTTGIHVDLAAECADTFLGVPPSATADRHLALSSAAPAGLKWTGETVTLNLVDCEPAEAPGSGTILVTPDGTIAAFTDLALEVVCESCEGGTFSAKVAYYANVTATVPAGIKTGAPFDLVLDLATNYDTDLRFSVAQAGAKATLSTMPSETKVDSPLPTGKTNRTVTVSLQASGPASGWTSDEITLKIEPVAHGKVGNGTAVLVKLPISNGSSGSSSSSTGTKSSSSTKSSTSTKTGAGSVTTTGTGASSGNATSTSKAGKDSPPVSPVLVVALIGLAVAWRRRR